MSSAAVAGDFVDCNFAANISISLSTLLHASFTRNALLAHSLKRLRSTKPLLPAPAAALRLQLLPQLTASARKPLCIRRGLTLGLDVPMDGVRNAAILRENAVKLHIQLTLRRLTREPRIHCCTKLRSIFLYSSRGTTSDCQIPRARRKHVRWGPHTAMNTNVPGTESDSAIRAFMDVSAHNARFPPTHQHGADGVNDNDKDTHRSPSNNVGGLASQA